MQILDESPVLDSEIDRLGHMNVMHYMERAGRANDNLLRSRGLTPELRTSLNAALRPTDLYCRFHREQFAGASLQVRGGLLNIDAHRARYYFEIRNPARDEIAATFIIENALVRLNDRTLFDFPEAVVSAPSPERVQIPPYGAPRSLNLEPPRMDVALAELQARVVDLGPAGMMSGQFEHTLDAADCDEYGYLREGANLMMGGRRPPADEDGKFGPPVLKTDAGHAFGWAILETRAVNLNAPKAGRRLCSIGADIALAAKSRVSRRWTFDKDSGALLGVHDSVAIALDLEERRAIEIPGSMRSVIEQNYLPEYA
jgi:acyl-CoA thioester hydrolase